LSDSDHRKSSLRSKRCSKKVRLSPNRSRQVLAREKDKLKNKKDVCMAQK